MNNIYKFIYKETYCIAEKGKVSDFKGRLPGLNNYLQAERQSYRAHGKLHTRGNDMKHDCQQLIIRAIQKHLRGMRIQHMVDIHYDFYEPNTRRDKDNISAVAHKFIQDAMVQCKLLENDGWKQIGNISDSYYIDRENPRIEVTLIESSDEY